MIRIAFPLPGSIDLTGSGGFNYLLNLAQVLAHHAAQRTRSVLFFGLDAPTSNINPFAAISGVEVVRTPTFDEARRSRRLREALLTGSTASTLNCFRQHRIDLVFECADFFGWRFPIPVLAWMPDFQHRYLKETFGAKRYWKRELGFRVQIAAGRHIMLSSEDSQRDCERFYPLTINRTSVVRFAVLPPDHMPYQEARAIARSYRLPEQFLYIPNQFWAHKNHSVVIDALALLRERGIQLTVAASGRPVDHRHPECFDSLKQKVRSLSLENSFLFLGVLPREHVFALMRTCTAIVNPSLFEGWSTPVEEAKSLAVPMLLSNLKVHMEQAMGSAKFFDPRSPLQLSLLMEQSIRLHDPVHLKNGRQTAFDTQKRIEQFCQAFLSAAERGLGERNC